MQPALARRGLTSKGISMRVPVALITILLLVSACARSASSHTHPDRVLYLYNWADYIGKDTVKAFEARTGIRVVYDTYDADETL